LVGFVKEDSFNIYTNNQKVIINWKKEICGV